MKGRIDEEGCKQCLHYCGKLPVNVPNFECAMKEKIFRVFFCKNFKKKAA